MKAKYIVKAARCNFPGGSYYCQVTTLSGRIVHTTSGQTPEAAELSAHHWVQGQIKMQRASYEPIPLA